MANTSCCFYWGGGNVSAGLQEETFFSVARYNMGSRPPLINTFDAEGPQWWGKAELIWFYSVIGICVVYGANAVCIAN